LIGNLIRFTKFGKIPLIIDEIDSEIVAAIVIDDWSGFEINKLSYLNNSDKKIGGRFKKFTKKPNTNTNGLGLRLTLCDEFFWYKGFYFSNQVHI